jgi:hypothetical protein
MVFPPSELAYAAQRSFAAASDDGASCLPPMVVSAESLPYCVYRLILGTNLERS